MTTDFLAFVVWVTVCQHLGTLFVEVSENIGKDGKKRTKRKTKRFFKESESQSQQRKLDLSTLVLSYMSGAGRGLVFQVVTQNQ
jgi:hypothetical protein